MKAHRRLYHSPLCLTELKTLRNARGMSSTTVDIMLGRVGAGVCAPTESIGTPPWLRFPHIHILTYNGYIHTHIYIYIHTYIYRERERERATSNAGQPAQANPQKALRGGIPGNGFGIWGRLWSQFEGNSRQKMKKLSRIDY